MNILAASSLHDWFFPILQQVENWFSLLSTLSQAVTLHLTSDPTSYWCFNSPMLRRFLVEALLFSVVRRFIVLSIHPSVVLFFWGFVPSTLHHLTCHCIFRPQLCDAGHICPRALDQFTSGIYCHIFQFSVAHVELCVTANASARSFSN